MYTYNVEVHSYIRVFFFSLQGLRTPPPPAFVIWNCVTLISDGEIASWMYDTFELIRAKTHLRQEPGKKLETFAIELQKRLHQFVRFGFIFLLGY